MPGAVLGMLLAMLYEKREKSVEKEVVGPEGRVIYLPSTPDEWGTKLLL